MRGTQMADHRFIIVDDHPLFRGALGQALSAAFVNAEVLEAGSLDELTDRLAMAGEIDLILLDLSMPGVHGVSGLLYLRAQHPEVPVVIVSASDDAATSASASTAARRFIPKRSRSASARRSGDHRRRISCRPTWTELAPPGRRRLVTASPPHAPQAAF
jgi:DNA-binding NarL/FixJ family response regulator